MHDSTVILIRISTVKYAQSSCLYVGCHARRSSRYNSACLFVYSTSLSMILSVKNGLNNLKGSCVLMLEGRVDKP